MATTTVRIEEGQIIKDVVSRLTPHLQQHPINGIVLEIIEDALHQEDSWWYVPVRLNTSEPHTYQYYDMLVGIEDEVAQQEHLKVLFVPAN